MRASANCEHDQSGMKSRLEVSMRFFWIGKIPRHSVWIVHERLSQVIALCLVRARVFWSLCSSINIVRVVNELTSDVHLAFRK